MYDSDSEGTHPYTTKTNYPAQIWQLMATEGELKDLRRTHYSSQITAKMDGQHVVVMGWVLTVRGHGSITFATIKDLDGSIPIVAKKGDCPDDIRNDIASLKAHSSVAVGGTIKASQKAPSGFEIIPDMLAVFSSVEKIPPFEPVAKTVKNIDTRLEVRHIDLRREHLQHIFKIRSAVLGAVRGYFSDSRFVEINTPKIISSATEGGAALFSIFYYDKQAFLAQSPQLYKEQLTMSFEKVFEIAPIFRAESSRTSRHLSEAISIDMEEAFVDYNDIMDRIEEIVRAAAIAAKKYADVSGINYNNGDNSDTAKDKTDNTHNNTPNQQGGTIVIPKVPDKIPRYTYESLVKQLQQKGAKTQWGDDLYPSDLKKLNLTGFYFIVDWPLGPKPFYVKEAKETKISTAATTTEEEEDTSTNNTPRISESFDLMYGELEISSGSTRIEKRQELESRMRAKGMDVDSFEYHLGVFDYGVPPHAGCGIGLERLMMALTGTDNIRDTTFYPRDVDRLVP